MLLKFIDNKIRTAFSNSALQYEALSGLQKEIGRELVKRIGDKEDCEYILDVGMGTGRLTNRLSNLFPDSKVFGMDFAGGMVKSAKQKYNTFKIIQADAVALPFSNDTFDIITSNLAYQWLGDLNTAFKESYAALKGGGLFCLTLFGRKTLEELFLSLESTVPTTKQAIKRLPGQDEVFESLQRTGFKNIAIETEVIKVHFEDMIALIRWIKDIGANAIRKDTYIGKNGLMKANEYYSRQFKDSWGVYASFEVIWVKGER